MMSFSTHILLGSALPLHKSLDHRLQIHLSPCHTTALTKRTSRNITCPVAASEAPNSTEDRVTSADWDAFTAAYTSQYEEHAFWLDDSAVEGTIPAGLQGTLLRNGPALFEIGGKKKKQAFDGDGMIAAFCFPGQGKAPFFANRFVRTEGFVEEQLAQKMLYRGAFSVGNPSGEGFYNPFDLSIKKIANTGVVYWGRKIMALYERDLPYWLTPPDLRTQGKKGIDCDGEIDEPYMAAHYRVIIEPDGSKRLVAFCAAEAGSDLQATVWEFDEDMKRKEKTMFKMTDAAFAFQHDMLATENYYVFLENPVRMDYGKLFTKYMFGKACIAECLTYDPKRQTKLHIIPRPGKKYANAPTKVVATPSPFFSFHHVNGYEDGQGVLVVDTVALHDGMDFGANLDTGAAYYADNVGRGTLTRLVVDLKTDKVTQQRLIQRAVEFPCVAPTSVGKPHTTTFLVAARFDGPAWGPPEVVCKVKINSKSPETDAVNGNNGNGIQRGAEGFAVKSVEQQVYHPGLNKWAQEPIYVPRPNAKAEDDGWVLVVIFDASTSKSELVILDAQSMKKVAGVRLPFMLPGGLHGSWTEAFLGAVPGQPWTARKYDIRKGGPLKYE